MNKIRIIAKKGTAQIVIKSEKGQQLNEREIFAINQDTVTGALHIGAVKKGTAFTLSYNITGLITLRSFLAAVMNREAFCKILQEVLSGLQSMKKAYFNQQHLILSTELAYVNPATQQLYFVYVPVQPYESVTSLKDFLLNIIQSATFDADEDNDYVAECIRILNSGIHFSVFELEEYLKGLQSGKGEQEGKAQECPYCHTLLEPGANFCPRCGGKIQSAQEHVSQGVYDPLKEYGRESKPAEPLEEEEAGFEGETMILGAAGSDATVLAKSRAGSRHTPYLVRVQSGEKIPVDKPVFKLGKKDCDYCITGNSTVSRSHAQITVKQDRYFITDLNSTNQTFVEGRPIAPQKEEEIFPGTRLSLSDEEFMFDVE